MKLTITKALTIELKGIAILMVIIGHVSQIFGASFLNYMGAFGVGIFLFISGYCIFLFAETAIPVCREPALLKSGTAQTSYSRMSLAKP